MKRLLPMFLIFAIGFLATSCSWQVSFYVVNESDSIIEAEYIIEEKSENSETPYKTSLENWNSWFSKNENWWSLKIEQFNFDAKTQTYKVKINPNEVLRFHQHGDSCVFTTEERKFHIKKVLVKGERGTIIYENGDFYRQFAHKSGNYYITYK
jgi:hypothetical protein